MLLLLLAERRHISVNMLSSPNECVSMLRMFDVRLALVRWYTRTVIAGPLGGLPIGNFNLLSGFQFEIQTFFASLNFTQFISRCTSGLLVHWYGQPPAETVSHNTTHQSYNG